MISGKKILLKAQEGITFRVQEGTEVIVIEAVMDNVSFPNSYDNYQNPYIPEGYEHLEGTWDTGFVIRNMSDGSEFVWIPVGYLNPDATLDGIHFNEKYGRTNWYDSDLSEVGYHEEENQELVKSIRKYGGYYFARYHASKENGKLVFKKGNMPWVNIDYCDAEATAVGYANGEDVASCVTSGAAFDTVLRWIIKSGAKTHDEVVKDSTSWGNYWNTKNSPREVMSTSSNKMWCACNIYDIAGNVEEWTSEIYDDSRRVLRGGNFNRSGLRWPAADRYNYLPFDLYDCTSFRAVLYKK